MVQATLALRGLQTATLTPRLQQSVRLLQLSSSDFVQEVEQALASNPFLEEVTPASTRNSGDERAWNHPQPSPAIATHDGSAPTPEAASLEGWLASPPDADLDRPVVAAPSRRLNDTMADPSDRAWVEAATTLRMHLHASLASCRLTMRERALVELVIEAVDDDGYLRQDLGEAAARFAFSPAVDEAELARALVVVQQLGPSGVGARSVAECLVLQIEQRTTDPREATRPWTIALDIARHHLDLLAARDWAGLERRLACTATEVRAAADLIQGLDPRPGSRFGGEVAAPIVPDVIVRRDHSRWSADINPAVIPRIALNQTYAALFQDARGGDRQPLGEQLQEARWLLRNAAQRFVTIRRVARTIVAEQAAFFDYGDIGIRPLLLRQVADQLELHESTVSRAISHKFIATPRGVFPFKHFFSRSLETDSGGSCSATSIRAAMRELIDREDRAEPLSDVGLTRCLASQGIRVARRTVTKYRDAMRIPSGDRRRESL